MSTLFPVDLSGETTSGGSSLLNRTRLRPDENNPWIGLFSFTEDIRQFFHGREGESETLARMVARRTLTVLYGDSGLGKSSLLQAGVFPRLRKDGLLPVYIRLNFAAPEAAAAEALAAVAQAIARALVRGDVVSGARKPEEFAPLPGETFWDYLHRFPEDALRLPPSADGTPGRPVELVLAFDQFEEIFTLGQLGRRGQRRGPVFALLQDLADCVENRLPARLKQLAEDVPDSELSPVEAARRGLAYHLILSLRKDFVAELDDLRDLMPSVMENRMLLRPLDGRQALDAVLLPGRKLVKPFVARRIVRFVSAMKRGGPASGPSEDDDDAAEERQLSELQVDPSLLSMVCRELNKKRRLSPDQAVITNELVEQGSRTILDDFYEECFRDQPQPAVRRFVEDCLLNENDRRRPWDLKNAESRLASDGVQAPAEALERLVRHRLVRVIEGADSNAPQVELAHDVLCQVVRAKRVEREAREAQEKEAAQRLAESHEREARLQAETERQRKEAVQTADRLRRLRRQRARVFAYLAVLTLTSIGSIYGLLVARTAARKAQAAEQQARGAEQQARAAEQVYEEYKLLGSKQNFDRARYYVARANQGWRTPLDVSSQEPLQGHNPTDATTDGPTNSVEPRGNVFALTHLARAVADNPYNTDAAALTARLLLDKNWCPPLVPSLSMDLEDVLLAVTASPDGQVAALSQSGRLMHWTVTGDGEAKADARMLVQGAVQSAVFSSNGRWLLIGLRERRETQLWGWDDNRREYVRDERCGIEKAAESDFRIATWSPDGQWLVVVPNLGTSRCRVFHRDAASGIYAEPPGALPHAERVMSVDISGNGQWIVTASFDGKARLWNTDHLLESASELVPQTPGSEPAVNDRLFYATFSPDPGGRWVAAVYAEGPVRIWDTLGGDRPVRLPISFSRDGCNRVIFSQDGQRLLATTTRGTARLWDIKSRRPVCEPMCHEAPVYYAGFSADGKRIVTGAGITYSKIDAVRVWDASLPLSAANADAPKFEPVDQAAPAWLAELAESISGIKLTATGYEFGPRTPAQVAREIPVGEVQGPFGTVLQRLRLAPGGGVNR